MLFSQPRENIDSAIVAKIKDEGINRSQVMQHLNTLCNVYGPRLTGSPGFKRAAGWAMSALSEWGISDVHLESWGPFGKGWTLRRYWANVQGLQPFPLISYPKAWSSGTSGTVTGDVIFFEAETDSAIDLYRGRIKGKFVLLGEPRDVEAHFAPEADRISDSVLLELANAGPPGVRGRRQFSMAPDQKQRAMVAYKKLDLCQKEGAAAILTVSRGDGGTIFVQGATVPAHPDTPFVRRTSPYDPKAPKLVPQIAVGAEHYNRLVNMLRNGEKVRMEMDLEVDMTKPDSGYNIIGEIPGTDLKDEVVMIGAHFDSWHAGTGATDDATGTAACMEAMRILRVLDLRPRRTIRIALWGGEEQGLLGSEAYVKKHFGSRDNTGQGPGTVTLLPDAENFSVYFNHDNGTGRIRGVYMEGNESARPIFRAWLEPFREYGASTVSLRRTGGTDHQSFDAIGLPAFQFIQDEIEYDTRTHHSNMDLYERVQEPDMKQAAVILAAFACQAANRAERFPRKALPVSMPAPPVNR
jgi:hypothetical protein